MSTTLPSPAPLWTTTCVGPGTGFVVVFVPACPLPLAPQHRTLEPSSAQNVSPCPFDHDVTTLEGLVNPSTLVGYCLVVVSPWPSSPLPLYPQHQTLFVDDAVTMAQASAEPSTADDTPVN